MLPVKIEVLNLGKIGREYRGVIEEYEKRLSSMAHIRFEHSSNLPSEAILLDPEGEEMNSEEFYHFLSRRAREGEKILFAVGPPEGFSDKGNHMLLSLSKLTFRHELAYLILLEQIYRALLRMKGTRYEK